MLTLHLAVGVALVICSVTSLLALLAARAMVKNIRLPEETGVTTSHRFFEVMRPEDVVDGYPVDAERFWSRMRRRKYFIAILSTFSVAVTTATLGCSISDANSYLITSCSLQTSFAVYVFVLSLLSIRQETHRESVLHLTALSTLAFALFGLSAIVPLRDDNTKGSITSLPCYALSVIYAITSATCFTTALGPPLHYPPSSIYSDQVVNSIVNHEEVNVCGAVGASPLDSLLFSYTTKVIQWGNAASSLQIGDLPILPANMRAVYNYEQMKNTLHNVSMNTFSWSGFQSSGLILAFQLLRLNLSVFALLFILSTIIPFTAYIPPFFFRKLVHSLERDPERKDKSWGLVFVLGLFSGQVFAYLMNGQVFSLAGTVTQTRLKIQLGSILYAKTLLRRDAVSTSQSDPERNTQNGKSPLSEPGKATGDFSSKTQILNLMTTDVDRAAESIGRVFMLISSCVETVVAVVFLYDLLGPSSFLGLGMTCLFLPLNQFSGKIVVGAQGKLMKARDERLSVMNELLGSIRTLKYMGWERSFERRVHALRQKELKYQRLSYSIETLWNALWSGIPIIVTLVSFWHFVVIRKQPLTPSIAFTSIIVFAEMRFALTSLPEIVINILQGMVSLRRVEVYLNSAEVDLVPLLAQQRKTIAFESCTATWASASSSDTFRLVNVSLDFPSGELSLLCGRIGSGKTLTLMALLGEVNVLSGRVCCPRTPPNSLFASAKHPPRKSNWIVDGACAYVSQVAWLQNASIQENILFGLPYDEERYIKTLTACALVRDLEIMEDGDQSEIGEHGINLSGGQKARVSLARAVYSRASILLLDDVLSAVDAHTAQHLYQKCLRSELVLGRTVILVSHQIQLCSAEASYVVVLDNGNVQFEGSKEGFYRSGHFNSFLTLTSPENDADNSQISLDDVSNQNNSGTAFTLPDTHTEPPKKTPRKLIQPEGREEGHVRWEIWQSYVRACGNSIYWTLFFAAFIGASIIPILDRGWLGYWSNAALKDSGRDSTFYISVYALITIGGLIISTVRWFVLYSGSIHASNVLYNRMLETVLFAKLRFHDTTSRGSLLNRFGKDFEGIDSRLSDAFGRTLIAALPVITTIVAVSVVGGPLFVVGMLLLGLIYWNVARMYAKTARDTRRLESVTRSPLYSLYGETISGVATIRAFGASSQFMRRMLRAVDANTSPYYWMWGVNRWLNIRFNMLSSLLLGLTGLICLLSPRVSAPMAGFVLTFVSGTSQDLLGMVRRFIGLEQSLIALERVKEYTDIEKESPEYIEPRPDSSWPSLGSIKCEELSVRYDTHLSDVLHKISFEIKAGEKVGILGRTGSGKSTLALSFFRLTDAVHGRIMIDGVDIAKVGITDLRSRLTIIPQDPALLSGPLRSSLDVLGEYSDAQIFEALRRVHLIPSEITSTSSINVNTFSNLDAQVSEGGDNFSVGEKQLLCMARAILKHSQVLIMDEATASVDNATDELIGKTIQEEFRHNTILTIAHRLRTVINYDRVMILEEGSIVEFDRPRVLLGDPASKFYGLCKAAGREEFTILSKLAGLE